MKLIVFSAKPYDMKYFQAVHSAKENEMADVEAAYCESPLVLRTVSLADEADAVCIFVNDVADAAVLDALHKRGVRAILLRCAGHNNVDLKRASELGMFVANVPSYSPEAVAEFAVALIQTLNRNTHRAYNRVREGNFALNGLLGNTLHGKTVGVVGTGRIGLAFTRIMKGFGCEVLAYDPKENPEFREFGKFVSLDELLARSDIVSLHCPLMDATRHIINEETVEKMKKGAMLVNTSRGELINTKAAIKALKTGRLGGLALDVYEGESSLFYDDHSHHIIHDDALMRLTTFPNVLVCGHQAFFTEEALKEISECTLKNMEDFMAGRECKYALVQDENTSQPVRTV
ncbi:hypothetical protein TD95_000239 [Thielaviopsis punctulata]|uniref:S-adenosyl-L-homocysteine hydrolase NAD binding domain-containing protein n=1 Tax=Thielaviopsis punctulata TaxID=72032 RepID=A0A0F4ZES9_9PEZI|nr:hypothetical protein TD95_000239 [Thielaviopsis punctulata]